MSPIVRKLRSIRYGPAALHVCLCAFLVPFIFANRGEAAARVLWAALFCADLPVIMIVPTLGPEHIQWDLLIWAVFGTLWWYLIGTQTDNWLRRRRARSLI